MWNFVIKVAQILMYMYINVLHASGQAQGHFTYTTFTIALIHSYFY